jgi:hypothetical protein
MNDRNKLQTELLFVLVLRRQSPSLSPGDTQTLLVEVIIILLHNCILNILRPFQ